MTGVLIRVSAEGHRALCTHDLTGLHPTDPTTRCNVFIAADPRAPGHNRVREPGARLRHPAADAVPVSQVNWTSAQHITADVPERH